MNFQMFKPDLEKADAPEIKLPISIRSSKKAREFQKNICFIDYAKAFDCVDQNKLENSLRDGNTKTTLLVSSETCMQVKKQQLEPDMKQWTGSKLGKEYVKAVYCQPAYLTYIQSASCGCLAG